MSPRRPGGVMALAAVLASTIALASASSAAACTVAGDRTRADHLDAADVVFTGTAVRVDDSTNPVYASTLDPLYWSFVVDSVEKGAVGERVTVATAMSGASCGYTFELGRRYRVYAFHSDWYDHLTTGLGSGNVVLASLGEPPRVEGEFHTLEYHFLRLGPMALPGLALIGLGWWVLRRSRASARSAVRESTTVG